MGWLPSAASGNVGNLHLGARSVAVSTSEMESAWPLATASSLPSGLSGNCEGAEPDADFA